MATRRVIDRVVEKDVPLLSGSEMGIQINHKAVIRDVPAWSLWVPDSNGRYVPLYPFAKVDSVTTTAITVDSAGQAGEFDPSDFDLNDPVNPMWLTANGGAQNITFFDKSASNESPFSTGAMSSEEEQVANVSSADINVDVAFSEQPVDEDIIFPAGSQGANIYHEAVVLPRTVTVDELTLERDDIYKQIAYFDCVLAESRLPNSIKQLITWNVIPTYGTKFVRIDNNA